MRAMWSQDIFTVNTLFMYPIPLLVLLILVYLFNQLLMYYVLCIFGLVMLNTLFGPYYFCTISWRLYIIKFICEVGASIYYLLWSKTCNSQSEVGCRVT